MLKNEKIQVVEEDGIATIWLNRPEKRNAFDSNMVEEILQAIEHVNGLPADTIVMLKGRGDVFCAGADLAWMQKAQWLNTDENYAECLNIAKMYYNLYNCNKVTIAVVQGAAYGGGLGLAAACDLAVSTDNAKFSLSELRIGVVASCISPYVIKKMGESKTKELLYTSHVFSGADAQAFGLVNRSVPLIGLNPTIQKLVEQIRIGAPMARMLSKQLIQDVSNGMVKPENIEKTAQILADVRIQNEAKERIQIFLKK